MGRGAGEVAQGFAALGVKAAADDARGAGKALGLEVAQESVDGRRPGAGLAVDDIADAGDGGAAATGEDLFVGHALCSLRAAPPHPQSLPIEGREAQAASAWFHRLPPPCGEGSRVGVV